MRFNTKLVVRAIAVVLALCAVVYVADDIGYRRRIRDPFFASAVPGDPVYFTMKPGDVKRLLGPPTEEVVMKDFFPTDFLGKETEWRETGEVILQYDAAELQRAGEASARFSYAWYSYNKSDNAVDDIEYYITGFATYEEALAVAQPLLEHAKEVFARRGKYTFEERPDGVLSEMSFRLRADKPIGVMIYDLSITDVNYAYHLERENPYRIGIYQMYFDN